MQQINYVSLVLSKYVKISVSVAECCFLFKLPSHCVSNAIVICPLTKGQIKCHLKVLLCLCVPYKGLGIYNHRVGLLPTGQRRQINIQFWWDCQETWIQFGINQTLETLLSMFVWRFGSVKMKTMYIDVFLFILKRRKHLSTETIWYSECELIDALMATSMSHRSIFLARPIQSHLFSYFPLVYICVEALTVSV